MNPFYNYTGSFIPGTLGRAEAVAAEFTLVQAGFASLAYTGTDAGVAANAYVVTTQGAITGAYADGNIVQFKPNFTNTGAATINVNTIGAVPLTRFNGASLQAGDLIAGVWTTAIYNATFGAFTLVSPSTITASFPGTISTAPPTHKVGLVAAGGVATAAAPIDVTFALDVTISPTWTGNHVFAPTAGVAITVNPKAGSFGFSQVSTNATWGVRTDESTSGYQLTQGMDDTGVYWQTNTASRSVRFLMNGVAALAIAGSRAVTIAAPTAGTALDVLSIVGGPAITFSAAGAYVASAINKGVLYYDSSGGDLTIASRSSGGSTTIRLATSNAGTDATRVTISNTGLLTVNTPTTGIAMTVNGLGTGSQIAVLVSGGGATAIARFDNTNAAGAFVSISNSNTNVGFIGTGASTITGAALGDFCIAATGAIRIGAGGGAGTDILISSGGNVTIAAPSSGSSLTTTILTNTASGFAITDGTSNLQIITDASHNWVIGPTTATTSLRLRASNVDALTIGTAGNITVAAPSSGVALSATGSGSSSVIVATPGGGSGAAFSATGPAATQLIGMSIQQTSQAQWLIYQASSDDTLRFNSSGDRVLFAAGGAVTINAPTTAVATLIVNAQAAGVTALSLTDATNTITFRPNVTSTISVNNALALQIAGNNAIAIASTRAVTISAPTSGVALTVNGVAGSAAVNVNQVSAGVGIQITDPGANATLFRLATTNTAISITGTGTAAVGINLNVGATTVISMNTTFNVVLANPTSGTCLVVGGVASSSTTITAFGPTAGSQQDLTPDTGSFTGTMTGITGNPTVTVTWRKVGKTVTLVFGTSVTGTSSAVSMTMSGVPAALQPATFDQNACAFLEDNGVLTAGWIGMNHASGSVTFGLFQTNGGAGTGVKWANGNFTASGTKGVIAGTQITYILD